MKPTPVVQGSSRIDYLQRELPSQQPEPRAQATQGGPAVHRGIVFRVGPPRPRESVPSHRTLARRPLVTAPAEHPESDDRHWPVKPKQADPTATPESEAPLTTLVRTLRAVANPAAARQGLHRFLRAEPTGSSVHLDLGDVRALLCQSPCTAAEAAEFKPGVLLPLHMLVAALPRTAEQRAGALARLSMSALCGAAPKKAVAR